MCQENLALLHQTHPHFQARENNRHPMFSVRLHLAQLELHSHSRWLKTFVLRSQQFQLSRTANYSSLIQHHGRPQTTSSHVQQRNADALGNVASYATKKFQIRKGGKPIGVHRGKEFDTDLEKLKQAVLEVRIEDVMERYRALKDKSVIEPRDFHAIAQCLHYRLRLEIRHSVEKRRRDYIQELVAFAVELVKDVRRETLRPNGQAHVHLIGLFKESGADDEGVRFWRWLVDQDDQFVNVNVYGAAIELLAVNGTPLSELEDLYQQALGRFPGSFAAYHLSPEAIVSDRNQAIMIKGIPMALFQGILTARLLRGDTRNAYLALDTALRLYPDQVPNRFFVLFLDERPLLEAYAVFALACRGGMVIPNNQFGRVLSVLRRSSDLNSLTRHVLAFRAMLSLSYVYIGAGGILPQNPLNELVIASTQILRLRGIASLDGKKKQQIVSKVMDIVRSSLTIFSRYGASPSITAFNSIITNLGGFGHSKQIVGIALTDAHALGLEPNEVTRRSILTAAGLLQDDDFVMKSWQSLVEARMRAGQHPDVTDLLVLAKAAHLSGVVDFARQVFESLKEHVPVEAHYGLASRLDSDEIRVDVDDPTPIDVYSLFTELEKVQRDLELIDERTKDRPSVQDFREQPLRMTLLPVTDRSGLPEEESRKLYDELTMEQPPSDVSKPNKHEETLITILDSPRVPSTPATSSTSIPFGTLRYENWKSINHLLEQAERSDMTYHKAVDEAIAAGVRPPPRTLDLNFGPDEEMRSYGLSDAVDMAEHTKKQSRALGAEEIQKARKNILRLRGRSS